jgi:hypothetical protein
MKSYIITAALLIAGTASIAVIGAAEAAPQIKLNLTCWPNFKQDGAGGKSYSCYTNVGAVCKSGYYSFAPTVKQISKNLYRIEYTCQQPPA